jgi:transglutaminase-like putative cysteine protease
MNYRVTHTTEYAYGTPVTLCHNLVHLSPRDCAQQICRSNQILIEPAPAVSGKRLDYFGNRITYFTVQEPHHKLTVRAVSEIDVTPLAVPDAADTPAWELVRDQIGADRSPAVLDAFQFAFDSNYIRRSAELADYAGPSFTPGRTLLGALLDLTERIYTDFKYDAQATTIGTPIHQVLEDRRGVCQDFAHLQIGCLRSLGLAARYVSGYLFTHTDPDKPRLRGADASHAWLSVFSPTCGWIDVDPTNNVIPSHEHLTVAWGRDYDDVSPIKGVILGGGAHSVTVSVDVVPVNRRGGDDRDETPA